MISRVLHALPEASLAQFIERVRSLPGISSGDRVIYTVLFGGVDELKPVPAEKHGWTFVCVTDRAVPEASGWNSVVVPWMHRDARRTARIFKVLPWIVAPSARCSLFVDASVQVTGALAQFEETFCQGAEMVCFPHPDRNCAYEEAQACIAAGKDDPLMIERQMHRYREEGFPVRQGLISSGVMYREHSSLEVSDVMVRWLKEIENGSCRDQLSFNYAVWRTGARYLSLEMDIYDNPYFDVMAHRVLRRFDASGLDDTTLRERLLFQVFLGKVWARRVLRRARRWRRQGLLGRPKWH